MPMVYMSQCEIQTQTNSVSKYQFDNEAIYLSGTCYTLP